MNLNEQETNPLPDYRTISLTQGKVAIVDSVDFDWLNQWKWFAENRGNVWYARRSVLIGGSRTRIYMHRYILGVTNPTIEIDHCDLDGLNNRRHNLRIASHSQNSCNKPRQRNNKTGFVGVFQEKRTGRWYAYLHVNGKKSHLGTFDSPEEAARERDLRAKELHGEFARFNLSCQ